MTKAQLKADCARKTPYLTRADAEKAAKRHRENKGENVFVYECRYLAHFHCGHSAGLPRKVPREKASSIR